jgi:uncharacterized membrane protein
MTTNSNLFEWSPFLAPFHAVVLHYPIGFLTIAFFLEIYRTRRPTEEAHRITTWVIAWSLFTGVIAATLGIMRAGSGGYEVKTLDLHRWFGMAVPFLTLLTLWLQIKSPRLTGLRGGGLVGWTYRGALLVTLAMLVIAGHYGGNLTHGSKYLVENAPEFIRTFLEEAPEEQGTNGSSQAVNGAVEGPGSRLYLEKIRPVLEAKCIRCHGQEKQKGKYRLDTREDALKPGESEQPGIKPNDPFESQVVRRIFLPSDHDEAMPPSGKEPLTPQEMVDLVQWIQLGAPYATGSPAAASQPASSAP